MLPHVLMPVLENYGLDTQRGLGYYLVEFGANYTNA